MGVSTPSYRYVLNTWQHSAIPIPWMLINKNIGINHTMAHIDQHLMMQNPKNCTVCKFLKIWQDNARGSTLYKGWRIWSFCFLYPDSFFILINPYT